MNNTITLTNTETFKEMMKSMYGTNKSCLTIEPDVIEQAVENGYIIEVGRNKQNTNIYYEFNKDVLCNTVLMHVRNNQFVLISKLVISKNGRLKHVVPHLLKYSFHMGCTSKIRRLHVKATISNDGVETTLYLHRALMSIEMNGQVELLNPKFDVHHKGGCFDGRQGMTMYIPRKLHKHSTSHMIGGEITNLTQFMFFCNDMGNQMTELRSFDVVA